MIIGMKSEETGEEEVLNILFEYEKLIHLEGFEALRYNLINTICLIYRNLSAIQDREICCYSISCKEKDNIGKITAHMMTIKRSLLIDSESRFKF